MELTKGAKTVQNRDVIESGRRVLLLESEAVRLAADKLDDSFYRAFRDILICKGRVILAGVGKSGQIAQKIASTLSSTGTPSFFIHPSEAMHGDFGMLTPEDCLIAISYGGETRELLALAKYAKEMGIRIIAITGNLHSSLAKYVHHVIDASVVKEADTLGLAPTTSSTVALAIGDALAVVVMQAKGITREKFALLHPGGSLGRELALVVDFMHPVSGVCTLGDDVSFKAVVDGLNRSNFGIAAVTDKSGSLIGCVSDGDLRRSLLNHGPDAFSMVSKTIMSKGPKSVFPDSRAIEAISLMEEHKITSLFVVSPKNSGKLLGLVRLHDLLSAKII